MAKKETQSPAREMMQSIASQTVRQMVLIVNSAPLIREQSRDEYDHHRHNTPWVIAIPALNICVEAVDEDGEPITGYFPDGMAEEYARQLWDRIREEPDLIPELQSQNCWPSQFYEGAKTMFRYINVQPIE